jgi:hypothetical protein
MYRRNQHRWRSMLVVLTTALLTVLGTLLVSPTASAHPRTPTGTRSLATVLAADGHHFDHRWRDFDITDAAVTAVLTAKPDSPVAVLADGTVPLTAFLPTDLAFRRLAHDLTGHWYRSEGRVFTVLASTLGVDTIESVLLYHVVPGATIDYRTALRSNGASLATALSGASITVKVTRGHHGHRCHGHRWSHRRTLTLVDLDPNATNPRVTQPNLNRGNLQIAHAINRVLRPVDL